MGRESVGPAVGLLQLVDLRGKLVRFDATDAVAVPLVAGLCPRNACW